MSNLLSSLTAAQLRQAADLKEKIATLTQELSSLLAVSAPAKAPKKKGGMSAAGRAKIAAAQKARWAKIKNAAPKLVVKAPVKKRKMSAAAKAKLSAAAKARWAKVKAALKPAV